MDELSETTLCVIKECFVYRIPLRKTATLGHRAAEWDVTSFIWTGRLVVKSKGENCVIRLEDPNTGELFAQSQVRDGTVEPVVDSKRYFVLRIENGQGKHAFVGMGFTDRDQAFDFTSALQDHHNFVKSEKEAAEALKNLENAPKQDYSLKEGEKIKVTIKKKENVEGQSSQQKKTVTSSGTGLLPPPPKAKSSPSQPTQQPQQSANKFEDLWSDFTGGQSSSSSTNNDWVAFQ